MEIRRNEDGTCYIEDCVGNGTHLVVDMRVTDMSDDDYRAEDWNAMLCEDHAFIIGFRDEGVVISPGVLVLEGEW